MSSSITLTVSRIAQREREKSRSKTPYLLIGELGSKTEWSAAELSFWSDSPSPGPGSGQTE